MVRSKGIILKERIRLDNIANNPALSIQRKQLAVLMSVALTWAMGETNVDPISALNIVTGVGHDR